MRFGPGEIMLILVVALVVFGPSKLPEMGKALGKGIREFKNHAAQISGGDETSSKDEK